MPTTGKLAYIAKTSKTYKPLNHVDPQRAAWPKVAFLWGDPVYVISKQGGTAKVSAKGHHINIPLADLTDKPVLHLYLIDCGQGDAALVQYPDGRWMMIDGGPPREQNWTNTGKIAFDFLK